MSRWCRGCCCALGAHGAAGGVDGWLGGTGFMLAVHHWLLPSLHVFIARRSPRCSALLWAPWGWLVRRLLAGAPGAGPGRGARWSLVPSGWLMVELVRSWEYLGGPWGLLGASQWQVTPALRLASVGGVWLVSFLLVAVNTAVAVLVAVPRARRRRRPVAALVAPAAARRAAAWVWAPRPDVDGQVRDRRRPARADRRRGSAEQRFERERGS